jgi:hypothetical protein
MAKKRLRAEEPDKLTPAQEKDLIDSFIAVSKKLKKAARKKARGKKPK